MTAARTLAKEEKLQKLESPIQGSGRPRNYSVSVRIDGSPILAISTSLSAQQWKKKGGAKAFWECLRKISHSKELQERLKDDLDVNYDEYQSWYQYHRGMALTAEGVEKIKNFKSVTSVDRRIKQRGAYTAMDFWPIFPNDSAYDWTEDNFGPLWVPKAGATVHLDLHNLPLYRRAIQAYEGNTLEVRGADIFINGAKADSYTFKQDYYWMMGDNRHRSQDARFWGFVPFDHVVGKAVMVWLTTDPEDGGFPAGIRWKRVFSLVR